MLQMNKEVPTIEVITPDMANNILKGNQKNRPIREGAVAFYAKLMQEGKWKFNGDTIRIAKDGTLIDGQHRLTAVVESNRPQKFLIVRDLDHDVFNTIDIGKKRTVADALAMNRVGAEYGGGSFINHNILAAAANIARSFDEDGVFVIDKSKEEFPPAAAMEYIEKNPGIVHSVIRMSSYANTLKSIGPISVFCAMHYVCGRYNKVKIEEFMAGFIEGANLSKDSPILALRNRMTVDKDLQNSRRGKFSRKRFISLFVTAFNAYCAGEGITGNQLRHNEEKAIIINGAVERRKKAVGGN